MTQLKPNILQLYQARTDYTVYGIQWIPQSARVLSVGQTARGTGVLSIWSFENKQLVEQSRHEKPHALKCATFSASLYPARHVATGDHQGNLYTFDVERPGQPAFHAKAHETPVMCVEGVGGRQARTCGAPEIATGGGDGYVRLFDVRQREPVMELTCSEDSLTKQQVAADMHVISRPEAWAVAFGGAASHSERYLACGFDSGDLKVVDLRMMRVCYERHFTNGVVSLEFDRADTPLNTLAVGTLEGHVYTLDLARGFSGAAAADSKPTGDSSTIWQVRHSPFNRDLALISASNRLILTKYDYPSQRVVDDQTVPGTRSVLADAVVTAQTCPSVCWSRDKEGLIAFGALDQTVNVGFVTNLKQYD